MRDVRRISRVVAGPSDVVAVAVAVDDMCDGLVGDFGDGVDDALAHAGRSVDDDDAFVTHDEHDLVDTLGDPVEAIRDLLDGVALLRVWRRPVGTCAGRGRAWHG